MLSIWMDEKLISKSSLKKIVSVAATICVPRSNGRLSLKIESNFAKFAADQLKKMDHNILCMPKRSIA